MYGTLRLMYQGPADLGTYDEAEFEVLTCSGTAESAPVQRGRMLMSRRPLVADVDEPAPAGKAA